MHWFYRPEDTCLLVDRNLVKKKAEDLAKADKAAWEKQKKACAARRVSFGFESCTSIMYLMSW